MYDNDLREKPNTPSYGVVTEQGDMGLGFSILNESEQKTAQEHQDQRDRG